MAASNPLVALVARELRKFPNVDPQAALAVASQEGLSGGVGDNGTSFGPWQLHQGGALPAQFNGDPRAADAWAKSPAGIDYALSQIDHVAGGKRGAAAVDAIVRLFERPANPAREVQGAVGAYGKFGGPGAAAAPSPSPAAPTGTAGTPDLRREIAAQLMNVSGQRQPDYTTLFQLIRQQKNNAGSPALESAAGPRMATSTAGAGGILDVRQLSRTFGDPLTSTVRDPAHNQAVGGAPDSYHLPQNAYVDGHLRTGDFAVNPNTERLVQYALSHPKQFVEFFYDPAGRYIKNGQVVKGSIGGHADHAHAVLAR